MHVRFSQNLLVLSFLLIASVDSGFKFSQIEMSKSALIRECGFHSFRSAEAVLAVLIPVFTFELPKEPIVWNVAGVTYPTMGKEATKPQMKLKVGFVKDAKTP